MTKPHCRICMQEIKMGQKVILTDMNNIEHKECYALKEKFIKDKGNYEEIVGKYPVYFSRFIQQ